MSIVEAEGICRCSVHYRQYGNSSLYAEAPLDIGLNVLTYLGNLSRGRPPPNQRHVNAGACGMPDDCGRDRAAEAPPFHAQLNSIVATPTWPSSNFDNR
jgi:hypothetical protein